MTRRNPVIILEFNELTPRLMDRFIAQGALPNFARLRSQSQAFVTDAGEDSPFLEPWIQWVDAHTGVPYREHGIQYLGDAAQAPLASIWDHVSSAGERVWVCGSMNATGQPGLRGDILPDPWSVNLRPSSAEFDPYMRFVRGHVLEYTRAKVPLSLRDQLEFAWFMLRHGLRWSTVSAIARQLSSERRAPTRWRRASILDRLQFDLFRNLLRRRRPLLATFFINSTAHYQHVYWRNLEPEKFAIQPTAKDQATYGDAVLFGYQQMDRILGETLDEFGDDATIIFMTALSQQPCLKYEAVGGKTFYKPVSYERLLRFAGIDPDSCTAEPVMSDQFHLRFRPSVDAAAAERRLLALQVDGRAAVRCFPNENGFIAGCAVFNELAPDARLTNGSHSVPFGDIFYHVDLTKSGMHDRPGLLWIRVKNVAGSTYPNPVALADVAPTVLRLMGLKVPAEMRGRDLLAVEKQVRAA